MLLLLLLLTVNSILSKGKGGNRIDGSRGQAVRSTTQLHLTQGTIQSVQLTTGLVVRGAGSVRRVLGRHVEIIRRGLGLGVDGTGGRHQSVLTVVPIVAIVKRVVCRRRWQRLVRDRRRVREPCHLIPDRLVVMVVMVLLLSRMVIGLMLLLLLLL